LGGVLEVQINPKEMKMKEKNLRIRRNLWILFILIIALASFATPTFAGGWATINIDSLPKAFEAGKSARIEFTVLQHGKTPVHSLSWDGKQVELAPILTATLDETMLEFEAQPAKQVGHWIVDVTLPEAGTWEWSITTEPLAAVPITEFEPLVVEPSVAAPIAAGSVDVTPLFLLTVLIGLGIVGFAWWRGRGKHSLAGLKEPTS
jgi:hypothetical protein